MDPIAIYSDLLVVLFIINLIVTYLLVRGVKDSKRTIASLNERAFIAVTKTISVGMLLLLGANRILGWHWPDEAALGLLVIATFITSASPIGWLWLYATNKFNTGNANEIVLFKATEDKE